MMDAGTGPASEGGPWVSCVLPTYQRHAYLPHAVHYFLRQDYPHADLLIVDDGPDSVRHLVPDHPRIRYQRLGRRVTLGEKLNLACADVRGALIAQWDDDDWYAPSRLRRQVEALGRGPKQVCGIDDLLYYDLRTGRAYRYVYPSGQRPWLLGASLCFRRHWWEAHPFDAVNVGMDATFVWRTPPELVYALAEPRFAVHLMHGDNVSPKQPDGHWWQPHSTSDVARLMGDDFQFYAPGGESLRVPRPRGPSESKVVSAVVPSVVSRPALAPSSAAVDSVGLRNVYACLVHESPECVRDLVENLRAVDSESTILLYDGSTHGQLSSNLELEHLGVVVHPAPRPMRWGHLHGFALDCMRFALRALPCDALTIVDSDQLALRAGWTRALREQLTRHPRAGLLGNTPERQWKTTTVPPAVTAWQEHALWRPFLRRFADGESKFVHWSFWPSTVILADAARALLELFDADAELATILQRSQLWATEEILFPTLTALLGFEVAPSPGSYDYVRYKVVYTAAQLGTAFSDPSAFWLHPVLRVYDDPLRSAVRAQLHAGSAPASVGVAARTSLSAPERRSLLGLSRGIRGWLSDAEAELLLTTTADALTSSGAVVEVGSHCGKATVLLAGAVRALRPEVRVWAIDPHDGVVGAVGQLHQTPPTLDAFQNNLVRAWLSDVVEVVRARSSDIAWSRAIALLLIDGLHDYANVASDFARFEASLLEGAVVAFHDYADYFPDVRRFVAHLVDRGYERIALADTLVVLRKPSGQRAAAEERS